MLSGEMVREKNEKNELRKAGSKEEGKMNKRIKGEETVIITD